MSQSNNFTTQKPLTLVGRTGSQLLTMLPASRVFVKSPDSVTSAPVDSYANYSFKSGGQTPNGWTDLGVMDAPAKLTYTVTTEKISTGVKKFVRRVYDKSSEATLEFSLWQLDDTVLTALGFNGAVVTEGSSMKFLIGQERVLHAALLCVYFNKLDGKEIHLYHPNASFTVGFDQSGAKMLVKVLTELTAFTPAGTSADALYALNIFSAGDALNSYTPPNSVGSVTLYDATSGTAWSLTIYNGSFRLAPLGAASTTTNPILVDSFTGQNYQLTVTESGSERLVPVSATTSAINGYIVSDAATGTTYTLQIENGSLRATLYSAPPTTAAVGSVTLYEVESGNAYSLSISGGTFTTSLIGIAAATTNPVLIDTITGQNYQLTVAGGGREDLIQVGTSSSAVTGIVITDSSSGTAYSLQAEDGTLVATPYTAPSVPTTTPSTSGTVTQFAITSSVAGNFTLPHNLGVVPQVAQIEMTSSGAIWFQTTRYDANNFYLVASDDGQTGYVKAWT